MSADLSTVRTALAARIRSLLPSNWVIVAHLAAAKTLTVPAVYFEFTRIEKPANYPPGTVNALVDILIVDPRTDARTAEDGVDAEVLELVSDIDSSQVAWTSARKELIEGAYLGWRVSVSVLASTKKE